MGLEQTVTNEADGIRYHFSTEPLNRTRLLLRTIGLFLVMWPHLFLGMTVLFGIAWATENLLLVKLVHQVSSAQEFLEMRHAAQFQIFLLGLMYFLWKIRWLSDHMASSKWAVLRVMLVKYIPVMVLVTLLYMLLIFSFGLFFFAGIFILPGVLYAFPLLMATNASFLHNLQQACSLIWGNWFYVITTVGVLCGIVVIGSVLIQGINPLNAIRLTVTSFSTLTELIRWYIVMPFFSCFIMLLLENACVRKGLGPLPRIKDSKHLKASIIEKCKGLLHTFTNP